MGPMEKVNGKVYLVGAGPGDPELLTLKAARLLARADVVVYDHLVGEGILDLLPAQCRRIYVGKESGNHTLPQEQISSLLAELGQAGGTVIRLKGGDPFVFGRGGEEIETLVNAGVPFEVVPGITAASGMSAYAGIPLTHRDYAHACIFVTGHLRDGSLDLPWDVLAQPGQTVVIYMGIAALDDICREFIAHGRASTTPAAVIRNATLVDQVTLASDLAHLPELCRAKGVRPPGLLVIGEVVSLAPRLDWFSDARNSLLDQARKALVGAASGDS